MWNTVTGLAGSQQPDVYAPDTTQRHPLGMKMTFVDPDFFGSGDFVYGKAAAAINNGRLSFFTFAHVATDIPNTANTGFPIAVSTCIMAINTFGWFQVSGLIPVQTAASVAIATATGVGAAGQAGTLANGKQILGARVVQPSTYAPTKNIMTKNGSTKIGVPNTVGLIQGLAVTGTGVGSSAVITAIDPSRNEITVDVASTASGLVTGTFTWTGFLLLSAPTGMFVQGQVA